MSGKNSNSFKDPNNLPVSEIDKYVAYDSESEKFSSEDCFKPIESCYSDENQLDYTCKHIRQPNSEF